MTVIPVAVCPICHRTYRLEAPSGADVEGWELYHWLVLRELDAEYRKIVKRLQDRGVIPLDYPDGLVRRH